MTQLHMEDLGTCCACGQDKPDVWSFVTLGKLAPVPGTGWGCFECLLPGNGALAVVCADCMEKGAEIRWAISGWAAERGRVEVGLLRGTFGHQMEYHLPDRERRALMRQ